MSEHVARAEARLDLVGGSRWLRSDGYYIKDGFIRLRPGAEFEIYDPWEEWRTGADEDRPYKRLLRLAQQLHPPRLYGPLPRRQQQLLEKWVRENGLLGILPHETLEASFAARWFDERRAHASEIPWQEREVAFVPLQRTLCFEQEWQVVGKRVGSARTTDPALEGELVQAALVGEEARPLETLRRRLRDGRLERLPIAKAFHGFFPDVPHREAGTYAYPCFDTDDFWRSYAESAWQFVHVARYLAEPLAALDRLQHKTLTGDDEQLIWRALARIDAIASVVNVSGWLDESHKFTVGWASPSLLGMYALMLLTDIKAGHQVRRCPNCETLFLAKNVRAVYCSSTCRHAQQKREWRKAKAAKREA